MNKKTIEDNTVRCMRVGHTETGLSFVLARCRTPKGVKGYCAKFGVTEPSQTVDAPAGVCFAIIAPVLPGVLPEALDGWLVEVHLVVSEVQPNSADDADHAGELPEMTPVEARRTELRHWRHEVGHAVDLVTNHGLEVLSENTRVGDLCAEDLRDFRNELPAMVSELLCESVDNLLVGSTRAPMSGLPDLYAAVWGAR